MQHIALRSRAFYKKIIFLCGLFAGFFFLSTKASDIALHASAGVDPADDAAVRALVDIAYGGGGGDGCGGGGAGDCCGGSGCGAGGSGCGDGAGCGACGADGSSCSTGDTSK